MASTEKVKKSQPNQPPSAKMSVKERRAREIARRQKQQQLLLTIVAVVLLVGVIAAVFLSTRPAEAFIPDDTATRYQDFDKNQMVGVTPEGYPYIGAQNAPSVLEEFSNFACPHCNDYHSGTFLNLLDKIKAGQLRVVYIPLSITLSYNPEVETRAALCAAQQGKFWEMHDVLFDWQTRYTNGSNDVSRLAAAAGTLGMDTGKFTDCINNNRDVRATIDKAAQLSTDRKVAGTPTIFLNGQQIQPALNGGAEPSLSELRGLIEAKAAAKTS